MRRHNQYNQFCSKSGFDPTAESLHVGNLLVIMGLLQAQRAGHKSLALIGGFTAKIGDPSGKSSERPSLEQDFIDTNTKGIERNLKKIFINHKNHNIQPPRLHFIVNFNTTLISYKTIFKICC